MMPVAVASLWLSASPPPFTMAAIAAKIACRLALAAKATWVRKLGHAMSRLQAVLYGHPEKLRGRTGSRVGRVAGVLSMHL